MSDSIFETTREAVDRLANELHTAISMELYRGSDERWDYVQVLLRMSGEILPRGLGMLQACHAARLMKAEDETVYDSTPTGGSMEGRSLIGVVVHAWISLAASRVAERHRAAFDRYREHDKERYPVGLPRLDADGDVWVSFFLGVERASYSSGEGSCLVYLAGMEATAKQRAEGRALALAELGESIEEYRRIMRRAYMVPGAPEPAPSAEVP